MGKYNKSEIMKKAWKYFKNSRVQSSACFSFCLQRSWKEAKEAIAEAQRQEESKVTVSQIQAGDVLKLKMHIIEQKATVEYYTVISIKPRGTNEYEVRMSNQLNQDGTYIFPADFQVHREMKAKAA